jgi:hypothetical protein
MMSVPISLLATLRGPVRSRAAPHAEALALHHQLLVLRRPDEQSEMRAVERAG